MPTRPPPAKIKSVIAKCLIAAFCLAVAAPSDAAAQTAPVTAGHFGVPVSDWTGAYVGGHIGAEWGRSDWSASGPAFPQSGVLGLGDPFDFAAGTGSYFEGLQAGYNLELPSGLVIGAQADVSFPNTLLGTQTITAAGFDVADYEEKVLFSGTLRGRLGYAFGPWLVYGTGGYAWADDQLTRTQVSGAAAGAEETRRSLRSGWVAGAGVETNVGNNWTANLEYLFTDFGSDGVTFPAGAQTYSSDLTLQNVRLGLNYQLGEPGSGNRSVLPASHIDDWAIHAQTTYLIQTDPDFRSPYIGPHSLIPGQSRETWDATFYLGLRLWHGAELWVDPEIDQGFGLSDTLGVAGFPSGEAYKVGNSYPYARLPRYFIRDTISLGGKTEKLEASANQFEGAQTENRLVLTLGKFGVTDVFDTNKYAHDPRADWMNWAFVDTGSFDYAADAWGYTYGAAAEWYQGAWTLRAGVFDLSIEPNSEVLDPDFSQYQLIAELEHRHELWGEPGKLAITGFVSRARMGTYTAAVALAEATGQPAEMAPVREYRSRPGIGFNAEQQVTPELGLFARAGIVDGEVEAYDFTDIDRTFAAGLVLKGKNWGRPDDVVGLAGVINGISSEHAAFFNAGGLGILVGDGILPNPGPEEILEAYYGFPIAKMTATLDYQFVNNPGYNEDRGPVSILGARLHTQF
jgi:high affinity Mn2+ porin